MELSNYKILLFAGIFSAVYIAVFFMVPDSANLMAFIPEKVAAGEWYRLFTFPFAHLNEWHLLENVASLLVVGFIATELKTEFYDFAVIYLATGVLAVIPVFLISSFSAIGASTAVYGAFGVVTQELSKFKISGQLPFGIMALVVFIKAITSFFDCGSRCESFIFSLKQAGAHFAGLVIGVSMFRVMNDQTINPHFILRGVAHGH
jgi:membrane associated rhomboid family serine protease